MHWDYILILLILGVVIPWRSTARIRELLKKPRLASSERVLLYLSTIAFQWLLVAVVLWRCAVHGVSLAMLGFALSHFFRSALIAAILSILLVFNQIYGIRRLASLPREKQGLILNLAEKLLPRNGNEMLFAVGLVVTVAICEEIVFRGFVQTIFQNALNDSVTAGVVISAVFFAVAHLYQGKRGFITTFIVGILFSFARVYSVSLFPTMVIHFFVDISAGIAVSKYLGTDSQCAENNDLMILAGIIL